jgi:hypothetical protein
MNPHEGVCCVLVACMGWRACFLPVVGLIPRRQFLLRDPSLDFDGLFGWCRPGCFFVAAGGLLLMSGVHRWRTCCFATIAGSTVLGVAAAAAAVGLELGMSIHVHVYGVTAVRIQNMYRGKDK